jgi:hypothetical protein
MKQFRPLIAIILAVFFSAEVHAKVVGQAIEYKHAGRTRVVGSQRLSEEES